MKFRCPSASAVLQDCEARRRGVQSGRLTCVMAHVSLVLLAACGAGKAVPPAGPPLADPAAAAAELQSASLPASPQRATFAWSLDDSGTRLSGRGVARYEAPARLRLDLFGPRGETYLAAALVDGSFRIPPQAAGRISLPSPALLWGALGVATTPPRATLASAAGDSTKLKVRYNVPGDEVMAFTASRAGTGLRLRRIERSSPSGILEEVRIDHDAAGGITRTRYRAPDAFRELVLNFETIETAASFDDEIFAPPGTVP